MGYAQDTGYTPETFETIMSAVMNEVNSQFGTTYTYDNFVGTNFYKFFYGPVQLLQRSGVKSSEIFLYLQDYFNLINDRIQRPVTTNPGIIENLSKNGYLASVKKPIDADAGKLFVCVDVDPADPDFAAIKLDIATILKDSTVGGIPTQGPNVQSITLSNGQSFDFKFYTPDLIEVDLKLTITTSENNQSVILSPEEVKEKLLLNISERYALGKNFEPQKYFTLQDAPWASEVLLEWSDDGGSTWNSTVFNSDFDELFDIALDRITVVEG